MSALGPYIWRAAFMVFLGKTSIARPDKAFGFLLAAAFIGWSCLELDRDQRAESARLRALANERTP